MKSLCKLLIVLSTLIINCFAQVEVSVDPPKPIKGESFNVIFKVKTDSNEDPFVSFNPVGLEVLGRRKEVSLQTTMINGKFSSSRNYSLIYEMVSDRQRIARIKDISIEIGGKKYSHKTVSISILGKRKQASPLFLKAEVSKNEVFLGEGVDVRYYLYSRVQIIQTEIKSFPKLKGFIKRFHKIDDREQTVEYGGLVYKRSLRYSARVYPEKTGKLSIDPLKLVLQFSDGRGSPFGGMGFGFSRFRSKGVNSDKVEVKVNPLPAQNVPPHFTGLIGKHEFSFTQVKNKFVVNEAIEGTLEVRGPGALEKLEPPLLFSSPSLEQFDAKSEFVETGFSSGRKTFEYTFLARANLSIEKRLMPLSYFDPETGTYVTVEIDLPKLEVFGGANSVAAVSPQENSSKPTTTPLVSETVNPMKKEAFISAPLFSSQWRSLPIKWPRYLSYFLFLVLSLMCLELTVAKGKSLKSRGQASRLIAKLKRDGMSYSELSQLIFLIDDDSAQQTGHLGEIIKNSQMPSKDIDYFLEALTSLEEKSFASDQARAKRVRFRASSFNELKKVIDYESL